MKTTDKMVLFWGEHFSQWYPCYFEVDGKTYNCAEQYMMAEKALFFGDYDTYEKIMAADHPRKQKALGRMVKNFKAEDWALAAMDVVVKGNIAKFKDPGLRSALLETGDREIVEASPYDTIWGIGLGENDPDALDKSKWQGTNWLGIALMKVRSYYKDLEVYKP